MAVISKRFSCSNDLVQIPLNDLRELLEPNFFRITVNADEIEIVDGDDESFLSEKSLEKIKKARKLYRENPEVFTQIVK